MNADQILLVCLFVATASNTIVLIRVIPKLLKNQNDLESRINRLKGDLTKDRELYNTVISELIHQIKKILSNA